MLQLELNSIMLSHVSSAFLMFFALYLQKEMFANADSTDIMSCVLCEMVVESMSAERNPAIAMSLMYRRCSRMGLLSPACLSLVDKNAKYFLSQKGHINGSETPRNVCIQHLKLCDQ